MARPPLRVDSGFSFAPSLTLEAVNPQLQSSFNVINATLTWENLSSELEKAEVKGMCYLRVKIGPQQGTYSGYPAGSPLKVTRRNPNERRAFFVRHWIRAAGPGDSPPPGPASGSKFALATDGRLLVLQTHIDRELELSQVFWSQNFGTWMFYVARIDCTLTTLPGVRVAASIERTISAAEKEVVERYKQPPPRYVSRQRTLPRPQLRMARPIASAAQLPRARPPAKSQRTPVQARALAQATVWEELYASSYYKPLFLSDDEAFNAKMEKRWVVHDPDSGDPVAAYDRLRMLPGSDLPSWYDDDVGHVGGADDDDFVPYADLGADLPEEMVKAIRGTVEYNESLESGRKDLKNWFLEDQKREDTRKRTAKETDADSSSDL